MADLKISDLTSSTLTAGDEVEIYRPSDPASNRRAAVINLPGAYDLNGLQLTLDADADTSLIASTDDVVGLTVNAQELYQFRETSLSAQLQLYSFDATSGEGPYLELRRQGGSQADSDSLGVIRFNGQDDAGTPNSHTYATIRARVRDSGDTSEDGEINLRVSIAGTLTDRVIINEAGVELTGAITLPDASLAIADTSGLQAALDLKAPLASPTFTGTVTVPNDSISYAEIQNVSATDRLLGRSTAGAGDIEEIICTAAARSILDDTTVAAILTTLGGATAANPVFTGTVTIPDGALAIADTSGLQTALDAKAPLASPTFTGTVTVPNDSISYAEIQNVSATDRLLGRDTAAAGDIEELTVTGGLEFTGGPGIQRSALTGDVTATAGSNATTIAAGAVTYAKMQDISAASLLLGRGSAAGAGDPQEIVVGSGLTMSGTTLSVAAGGGNVSNTGTPVDNQLAIWTDAQTIEGDSDLTWSGTLLTITGALTVTGAVTLADASLAIADTSGLQAALDLKAPLASPTFTTALTAANPTFTGTVTIPDGALAIADTSGLQTALDGKQPLDADLTTLATAFVSASAAGPASLALAEDTDSGTMRVVLTAPSVIATSDKTVTFQDVAGTVYVSGGTDIPVADGGTGGSDAATARTNLGLAIGTNVLAFAGTGLVEQITGHIETAANKSYVLDQAAAYAYTINTLIIDASGGTCTAKLTIDGVDVTGISAVSVSTTEATGTASAANSVAVGNTVALVISANSAALNVSFTMKTARV